MDKINVVKETTLTVEKKPLVLLSWRSYQKTSLIIVNCKKTS